MAIVTAILCTALSIIGFFFSLGLGEQWWLAWLAPVPVLWLAFADRRYWPAFLAAWAAFALGSTHQFEAYWGRLPPPVLALSIFGPSLLFAFSVTGASYAARALGAIWGVLAFATLWTAFDFLTSFSAEGGAINTPAVSQVGMPLLVQGAALVGPWIVTFLLGFVSAGIAKSIATRTALPAALALALFAANAAFGFARMQTPATGTIRVALIDTDDTHAEMFKKNEELSEAVVDAYAKQVAKLGDQHVKLVLWPENSARVEPEWRKAMEGRVAAAADSADATLVAGFNDTMDGVAHNVSWAFQPGAQTPLVYVKRRLVPVLETSRYEPGTGPEVTKAGVGLEICKDMDFQAMIRRDEVETHPRLLAVPAWDFGADGYFHARGAILRSVENGVAMARDARDGVLSLSDRFGRVVAMKNSGGDGFTVLIGELPLSGVGGDTVYDAIGDVFGWLCVAGSIGLMGLAFLPRRTA